MHSSGLLGSSATGAVLLVNMLPEFIDAVGKCFMSNMQEHYGGAGVAGTG